MLNPSVTLLNLLWGHQELTTRPQMPLTLYPVAASGLRRGQAKMIDAVVDQTAESRRSSSSSSELTSQSPTSAAAPLLSVFRKVVNY